MNLVFQRYLAAPPQVVWPYISLPARMNEWSEAPIKALESGEPGVSDVPGARRRIKVGPGVAIIEEIVVADRPRRFEYRVIKGGGLRNHHGVITLTPAGRGTFLEWRIRFDAVLPGLARVVGALLDPPFQRSLDKLVQVARATGTAQATA